LTKTLVFDLEADGLLLDATKIHSLVTIDADTEEMYSGVNPTLHCAYYELAGEADTIVGHNIIGYDLPVLRRCLGDIELSGKTLRDTLILTRLLFPDIKAMDYEDHWGVKSVMPANLLGSYSLEAWGWRLGIHKGSFGKQTDWSEWSHEMQEYCEQDTKVTLALWRYLQPFMTERWASAIELEHRFAEIIAQQEQHGFALDMEHAHEMHMRLAALHDEIHQQLVDLVPPTQQEMKTPQYWVGASGKKHPTKGAAAKAKDLPAQRGPNKVKETPFNPGSRPQVTKYLMSQGWEPTKFTDTGLAVLDDETLASLEIEGASLFKRLFKTRKIMGQLATGKNAVLKLERNGRIHGGVITCGAVTRRCTHKEPNVAQTPKVKVNKQKELIWGEEGAWGADFRAVYTAGPGNLIVGWDGTGIQSRCLGHYLESYDSGAYIDVLLKGDIHALNQKAFGLPPGPEYRPRAKTGGYAHLFGSSPEPLGRGLEELAPEHESKAQSRPLPAWAKRSLAREGKVTPKRVADWKRGFYGKQNIERRVRGLGKLIDALGARAKNKKPIHALDGAPLSIRKKHAALNTLLQSAEAVLMKRATVLFVESVRDEIGLIHGVDWSLVAHVHDEVQSEVPEQHAEAVAKLGPLSLKRAGELYNFKCPLDGEAKIGRTWAETH